MDVALAILNHLAEMKFPPAIILLTNLVTSQNGNPVPFIEPLKESIEKYSFYSSCSILAALFIKLEKFEEAKKYFKIGNDNKDIQSKIAYALFLNPYEEPQHSFKDFNLSEKLLLEIINENEEPLPRILFSLAILYSRSDKQKSLNYLNQAKKADPTLEQVTLSDICPDIEPIPIPKIKEDQNKNQNKNQNENQNETQNKKEEKKIEEGNSEEAESIATKVALGSTVALAAAGIGYFIYRFIKNLRD